MTYTPDYKIQLSGDRIVPLLFNSWAFRKYTQLKGIEFEDLVEKIGEGKAFLANDLPDLILIAAEAFAKFNAIDFKHTDTDAYTWIDEMGGFNSTTLLDLYKVFVSRVLNISPEKLDVLWNKAVESTKQPEEKKKETEIA